MKKKYKVLIAVFLSTIIAATAVIMTVLVLPFPLNYGIDEIVPLSNNIKLVENENELPFLYKEVDGKYSDEPFKIINFTDTHLGGSLHKRKENNKTIEMLKKNIETENPDLITITGDIIVGYNFTKGRIKKVAELMEAYNVYWAPILGNHDCESSSAPSREDEVELLSTYKHCLIKKGSTDGNGNYIVNIKSSESAVSQSLILMDSGDYMSKEEIKSRGLDKKKTQYAYITPNQIQWYKDSVTHIKDTYGENTKSMVFIHIPLPEYKDAFEKGEIISGDKRENVSCSRHNSGMFDAILEMNCTHAIFAGHDHVNNYNSLYKGINFVFAQPSGYGTYDIVSKGIGDETERLQGCTVITINSDGTFNIEQLSNTRF